MSYLESVFNKELVVLAWINDMIEPDSDDEMKVYNLSVHTLPQIEADTAIHYSAEVMAESIDGLFSKRPEGDLLVPKLIVEKQIHEETKCNEYYDAVLNFEGKDIKCVFCVPKGEWAEDLVKADFNYDNCTKPVEYYIEKLERKMDELKKWVEECSERSTEKSDNEVRIVKRETINNKNRYTLWSPAKFDFDRGVFEDDYTNDGYRYRFVCDKSEYDNYDLTGKLVAVTGSVAGEDYGSHKYVKSLIEKAGAVYQNSVTYKRKKTAVLVYAEDALGDKSLGLEPSGKYKDACEAKKQNSGIEIVNEKQFFEMLGYKEGELVEETGGYTASYATASESASGGTVEKNRNVVNGSTGASKNVILKGNNGSTGKILPAGSMNAKASLETKISVYKVGQGNAIFIEYSNGRSVLFDAGTRKNRQNYDESENKIMSLRPNIIIISHWHYDHYEYLVNLINEIHKEYYKTGNISLEMIVCPEFPSVSNNAAALGNSMGAKKMHSGPVDIIDAIKRLDKTCRAQTKAGIIRVFPKMPKERWLVDNKACPFTYIYATTIFGVPKNQAIQSGISTPLADYGVINHENIDNDSGFILCIDGQKGRIIFPGDASYYFWPDVDKLRLDDDELQYLVLPHHGGNVYISEKKTRLKSVVPNKQKMTGFVSFDKPSFDDIVDKPDIGDKTYHKSFIDAIRPNTLYQYTENISSTKTHYVVKL